MTRTLESNELICQRHHASQRLKFLTISRVGILHLVVVIVTDAAKPYLAVTRDSGQDNVGGRGRV